jgi:hypothetical protein
MPSSTDQDNARTGKCGPIHYIVSLDKVVAYFEKGEPKEIGDRKSVLPQGVPCTQEIPPEKF